MLEGEKYVTSSWVPVQIKFIHDRLKQGTQTQIKQKPNPVEVQQMSKHLLRLIERFWEKMESWC